MAGEFKEVLMASLGAERDSDSDVFYPSTVAHIFTYNGDGTLATDSCTVGSVTRKKTYTYTTGRLTGESAWVKQ